MDNYVVPQCFARKNIQNSICNPTGKGKGVNSVIIGGPYTIKWEQVFYKGAIVLNKKKEEYRYYFHEFK